MNKRFLCFLLILSLVVPFFPCFDFVVFASSVSDNNTPEQIEFMENMGFHWNDDMNLWIPDNSSSVSHAIEYILADQGFVTDNYMTIVADFILGVAGVQWDNIGYSAQQALQIQQSGVTSQNVINYSVTYAENNVSYFVRSTINISDLFSAMYPYGSYDSANWQSQFNQIKTFINASGGPYITALYFNAGNLGWGQVFAYRIDKDLFMNDLQFYLYTSQYDSIFFDNLYGIFNAGEGNALGTSTPVYLGLASNGLAVDSVSCDGVRFIGSNIDPLQTYYLNYSSLGYGLLKYIRANTSTFAQGTVFVIPDGFDNFEFPIFKNLTELQGFFSGNSKVYQFDSSVDLGQYGEDIDYSKLYDIIGSAIRGSDGNVIQAINNAADNYLQQQIDLLHDINNALNDGNGQSWFRKIYDILDYNFPLTLTALQDLRNTIENISISGGSADLTYTNRVLDQINDKLGFLIDRPVLDGTPQDFEELRTLAQNKFPFCVFSDIVALTVILNQSPEEPHWQVPLKLPGSASVNNVEVDLSWYEYIRDYVHAIFIFMFIIGLLVLSVKIFDAVKS